MYARVTAPEPPQPTTRNRLITVLSQKRELEVEDDPCQDPGGRNGSKGSPADERAGAAEPLGAVPPNVGAASQEGAAPNVGADGAPKGSDDDGALGVVAVGVVPG